MISLFQEKKIKINKNKKKLELVLKLNPGPLVGLCSEIGSRSSYEAEFGILKISLHCDQAQNRNCYLETGLCPGLI